MLSSRDKRFSSSDSALTSSILDHFESMQADIKEEDKWTVSGIMRYMLEWPAAPPIRTVILGQSPYPAPAEVPFVGAPFAYTGKDAPPSVVVLANTVSTCSAINNITGLDWQTCEDLFKNSDTLLEHGIVFANARSSSKFEDEKAARECATLVACLVHLLRRPSHNTSEPIDIICMGVEAQRVCTLITKIWGTDPARRPIHVAKCSHPAHLARKERKMYRYCIRLDDPTATRMLTEALVGVIAERNNLDAPPVSQPQDSRYIKRQGPQSPNTPPQQSPPKRSDSLAIGSTKPRAVGDSLGVGNFKPKPEASQSLAIGAGSSRNSGPSSTAASESSPSLRSQKSAPVAYHSSHASTSARPAGPPSINRRASDPENRSHAGRAEAGAMTKSMSASIAEEPAPRPRRNSSLPLLGGDQADYNMAKALKDTARRAAIVLDSAAKSELTQQAMINASHALSDLASVAKILQDRVMSSMDAQPNAPKAAGRHADGPASEVGSAVSTLAYAPASQPLQRAANNQRGARLAVPPPTVRRGYGRSQPTPAARMLGSRPSPSPGSSAHLREVELMRKALGPSIETDSRDREPAGQDPGYIDPDSAKYTDARNGSLRAAQRTSLKLTARELEAANAAQQTKGSPRTPAEVPLPDQESSVDDEENVNEDDFASVASERLNDAELNSAILQTMNEELLDDSGDPSQPLVSNGDEKSNPIKATMEGVIWRLYNRQLGKDNQASTAQLSA